MTKNTAYKISIKHKKNLKKLVIISGQQKAGKSLLTKIISKFQGPVQCRIDFFLESLLDLHKIKLINKKQLTDLFLIYSDHIFIDNIYGRNYNLKKNDESSIFNTANPQFFLNKINKNYSRQEIQKLIKKKQEMFIVIHNFIKHIDLLEKASVQYKVVNIVPHPIDQLYSMFKSNMFKNYDDLDREIVYEQKGKKQNLDNFFLKKFKTKQTRFEKILQKKKDSDLIDCKVIKKLRNTKFFLNIKYDEILLNYDQTILKLSRFLQKKKSALMKKIEKQKFFIVRQSNLENRNYRYLYLQKKISSSRERLLFKYILNNYDKNV
jgi:hypothetical protein